MKTYLLNNNDKREYLRENECSWEETDNSLFVINSNYDRVNITNISDEEFYEILGDGTI